MVSMLCKGKLISEYCSFRLFRSTYKLRSAVGRCDILLLAPVNLAVKSKTVNSPHYRRCTRILITGQQSRTSVSLLLCLLWVFVELGLHTFTPKHLSPKVHRTHMTAAYITLLDVPLTSALSSPTSRVRPSRHLCNKKLKRRQYATSVRLPETRSTPIPPRDLGFASGMFSCRSTACTFWETSSRSDDSGNMSTEEHTQTTKEKQP